jgi:hypothetical protein
MKLFISHSGGCSREMADYLRNWLREVRPGFWEVWMDKHSIDPGREWSPELRRALRDCDAGIVCVTPENANAAWPIAEFACLWNGDKVVVPYLLDGRTAKRLPGPMTQARASVSTDAEDAWMMVSRLSGEHSLEALADLRQRFDRAWPELQSFMRIRQERCDEDSARKLDGVVRAVGEGPVRTATFDYAGPRSTARIVLGFLEGVSRKNPPRSLSLVVNYAVHVCAILGFLALVTGVGMASTPSGRAIAAGVWEAIVGGRTKASAPPITGPSTPAKPGDTAAEPPPGPKPTEAPSPGREQTTAVDPPANPGVGVVTNWVRITVTNLVERTVTNFIATNVASATSNLLFLPPDQIDLRSLLPTDPPRAPEPGDTLLLLPRAGPMIVPLYSGPFPGPPVGILPFGVPLRVTGIFGTNNLSIRPLTPGGTSGTAVLQAWSPSADYLTLRLGESGLQIPGWSFAKSTNAPFPEVTLTNLLRLRRPATPEAVQVEVHPSP